MPFRRPILLLAGLGSALLLGACALTAAPTPTAPVAIPGTPAPTVAPTATVVPPRLLTICQVGEPTSLFAYADSSRPAAAVRAAIYDGPIDLRSYTPQAVILAKLPALADGDAALVPTPVQIGDQVVDAKGELIALAEGSLIEPSGCQAPDCAVAFSAAAPVSMDQLVARFMLRPGLTWADGAPLTAADSLYAFAVAQDLYPQVLPELVARTAAYTAVDELTVEWRGLPGFRSPAYRTYYFAPLPEHAWGDLAAADLLTADQVNRTPLGWGAFQVTEWTAGDHLTLTKNPRYFRAAEGLPYFDTLVFRFMASGDEALTALRAGECDFIDEGAGLESRAAELRTLEGEGQLTLTAAVGTAWEHLDFNFASAVSSQMPQPADAPPVNLFLTKEVRQGVALCLDREALAQELFGGESRVPDTFVPPDHPLANPDARRYAHDPAAGANLLTSVGWLDSDNNPATPRLSQGVTGVPDGTPLAFTFTTQDDPEKRRAADRITADLAACGMQVAVQPLPWEQFAAPGPEGPVFGRKFQTAQFAWVSAAEPPCFLYQTSEIPGDYPSAPRGWGGANVGGYSNPTYDAACNQARRTLPDNPGYQAAQYQTQAIFAEDLPVIPLYLRLKFVLSRPGLCNILIDPAAPSALWNLEAFASAEACNP
jgi:peptide/nickel transport system substrate-binding protein